MLNSFPSAPPHPNKKIVPSEKIVTIIELLKSYTLPPNKFNKNYFNSRKFNLFRKGIFMSAEGTSGLEAEGREVTSPKGEWPPAGARKWAAKPANF